mgnify:CR=1 FL=1
MLDAACPGQVFTSPTPDQWMAAAHAVNAGRGVLFIYNIMDEVNYNERGNRLTMVKRNDNRRDAKPQR